MKPSIVRRRRTHAISALIGLGLMDLLTRQLFFGGSYLAVMVGVAQDIGVVTFTGLVMWTITRIDRPKYDGLAILTAVKGRQLQMAMELLDVTEISKIEAWNYDQVRNAHLCVDRLEFEKLKDAILVLKRSQSPMPYPRSGHYAGSSSG